MSEWKSEWRIEQERRRAEEAVRTRALKRAPQPVPEYKPRSASHTAVRDNRHSRYRATNRETINRRRAEQRRGTYVAPDARPLSTESRQVRWQKKKQAEGCCRRCGNPRDGQSKALCESCRAKVNTRRAA